MRIRTTLTLLILGQSLALQAQSQPRGEAIGEANTNTSATIASSQTNGNPSSLSHTNLADGALVGFRELAGYEINLTDELAVNTNRPAWADARVTEMIPADVRALDHRNISVEGFMIPCEFDKGKVVEFILAESPPSCCYGGPTQIHDWIKVRVKPPGVLAMEYNVIRARGVLSVGPKRENGVLSGIYSMEAETVGAAPEK